MKTIAITDVSTDGAIADRLGAIRAEVKRLKDEQALLEGLLKEKHVETVEGDLYRVSVSYDVATNRIDWRAVAEGLNPSKQRIAGNSKVTYADRVRVTAMTK